MTTFTTQDRQDAQHAWKAYEEIQFAPDLIQRWIREGDEYVNRMTKEQMYEFARAIERAHGIGELP